MYGEHQLAAAAGPWCTSHVSLVIVWVADTEVRPGRQPVAGSELRSSVGGNSMEQKSMEPTEEQAWSRNLPP